MINGSWFGIIEQSGDNFAIKTCNYFNYTDLLGGTPDVGVWLTHPEKRYETEGGAFYAILLHLESNNG